MTATPSPTTPAPSTPAPSTPEPTRRQPSPPLAKRLTGRNGSRLLVTLLAVWIIFVSFIAQMSAWIQASFTTMPGDSRPWWIASLVQAALIGLPALGLALRWRIPRYRAIFQSWAWATGYLVLMTPTRLLPPVESQLIVLLQAVITFGYWLVLRRWQREAQPVPPAGFAVALLVAGISALPWLRWGALGSPLDIVLNCLLAGGVGLLLWTILHLAWIPALRREPRHPRRDRFTSGLVAGMTLLILASALSFNGVQVLLMIMLPALGWAVVSTGALALATALVVAVPLLLVDTDALVLVALDWLLVYYIAAASIAASIGWLLAALALLPAPDPAKMLARPVAWAGTAVALLLAGLVYLGVSYTGFYGDRLFVVMATQADIREAAAMPDVDARRTAVYGALVDHADATQAELRAALDRFGIDYQPYYLTNGLEVNGGLLVRLWLEGRDDVAAIMVSPRMRPVEAQPSLDATDGIADVAPSTTPSTTQWNLTAIGADRVWRELGITGEGIVIGQSDSGVQLDHPEYRARYRGASEGHDYNWLDPWAGAPAPYDLNGHGTHTLGTILGQNVGVAPGASWIGCANLLRNLGNAALYLDCMQFTFAPFPQGGNPLRDGDPSRAADVLNNSWGCPTDVEGCAPPVFAPAIDALTQAGVYVVVSAGNQGPQCGSVNAPPAIYEQVLSVGALDKAGDLAMFSSVGPVIVDGSRRIKPDIVAPGVDVLSAWPGSSYEVLSGTSMAGPHLAGTVALMWSANPALRGNVARTTAILQETARPFEGDLEGSAPLADEAVANELVEGAAPLVEMVDAAGNSCLAQSDLETTPNIIVGYGVVDAYAAVQAALAEPAPEQ